MSVASANVFALLDDEGTVDAGELAAKLPVTQKEAPKKADDDTKQGESHAERVMVMAPGGPIAAPLSTP